VTWFLKSTDTEHLKNGPAVKRDFAVSAAAVEGAFGRILDRLNPDVVLAVNGLFAAERAVRAVAADRGVRVVTYEVSPRKDCLVFGENSPAPEMNMDGLAEDQSLHPLSRGQATALDALLDARESGASAHERYFDESQDHRGEAVRNSLGIEPGKSVISAFTNLAWDSALFGNDIAYTSQFDWLARLCELMHGQPSTVLAIRVHPAESRWGTGQPIESELHDRIGELPENVRLIRPDDSTSSYGLLAISDLALCYTTTVGLEAAVRGVPVAVVGRTHYRGRGFTVDVETDADLARVIADRPAMSTNQIELARRYAFAFFFRRMVPFRHVRNDDGRISGIPQSAEDLLPGHDPYLDFLCDRILAGGEFFLPSTLALEGPSEP
jgi:hypothetical protein